MQEALEYEIDTPEFGLNELDKIKAMLNKRGLDGWLCLRMALHRRTNVSVSG